MGVNRNNLTGRQRQTNSGSRQHTTAKPNESHHHGRAGAPRLGGVLHPTQFVPTAAPHQTHPPALGPVTPEPPPTPPTPVPDIK